MPARLLGIQTGQLLVGMSEWFSIRLLGFVPSLILRASRLTHNRLAAPKMPKKNPFFRVLIPLEDGSGKRAVPFYTASDKEGYWL